MAKTKVYYRDNSGYGSIIIEGTVDEPPGNPGKMSVYYNGGMILDGERRQLADLIDAAHVHDIQALKESILEAQGTMKGLQEKLEEMTRSRSGYDEV